MSLLEQLGWVEGTNVNIGASGGNDSIGGTEQRAGIRTLDPYTNKTTTLLNNYFGWYFNTVDDLFVDSHGDVWFTDPGTASSFLHFEQKN